MIFDAIGLVGVFGILLAYFMLQTERWNSDQMRYSATNLVGALLILVSLTHTFNLASFVIELAWIAISVFGFVKLWRGRRAKS